MNRETILKALDEVKPGIATKGDTDAMTYFYFTGTHVVTYNKVISIQHPLKTNFTAFVKASDFYNFVTRVTSDDIQTNLEGAKLKLKSGKVNATLLTITDKEVTDRIHGISKQISSLKWFRLPENFGECLNLCKFAASTNEASLTLTCLNLDGVNCLAADNSRAAYTKFDKPIKKMLVKASEVRSLLAIKPTGYSMNKSWIFFRNKSGCTFAIRSVKGDFPDFMPYFDFEGTKITIPEELLEGIDIASIFIDVDSPKININISDNSCIISAKSTNGSMDYPIKITYKGDPFNFSIDPRFLEEMMKHSTDISIFENRAKISSGDFQMVISLFG